MDGAATFSDGSDATAMIHSFFYRLNRLNGLNR
jgi:hypothetical protein